MNKPEKKRRIGVSRASKEDRHIHFNASVEDRKMLEEFGFVVTNQYTWMLVVDSRYDFDEVLKWMKNLPKEDDSPTHLKGYESPTTIMVCPKESWAIDFNENKYRKMWYGCGWTGQRGDCNGIMTQYMVEYNCPKCGVKVENKEKLDKILKEISEFE